jgi:hypothetical protein
MGKETKVFKEFNQLSSVHHKFWELFLAQTLVYAVEYPNFSQKGVLLFPRLSKHLNILLSRSGKYPPNINKQSTQNCLFLHIKVWSEIKFCNFRIKGTSTRTFLITVLPIHVALSVRFKVLFHITGLHLNNCSNICCRCYGITRAWWRTDSDVTPLIPETTHRSTSSSRKTMYIVHIRYTVCICVCARARMRARL